MRLGGCMQGPLVSPWSSWRRVIVAALCLVGALAYATETLDAPVLWLPAGLLMVSAALVGHRVLSAQLMVRAVLWCHLLLGFLMSIDGGSGERPVGCVVALATGTALVLLGRRGLEHSSPRFSPTAFRGSLILALVMALADAQSLALFGLQRLTRGTESALPLLACTTLMIVALVGLYRLRLWGVVLNIVGNLLVAGLAIGGGLDLPDVLVGALCTTAVIQLLLPIPMLVAMARGRAPEPGPSHPWRAYAVPALVVLMQAISVYGQFVPGRLL